MDDKLEAHGLAGIRVYPTGQDHVVVLGLTDTTGKETGFAFGPEGLTQLLMSGIGLASQWADHPDFSIEALPGKTSALPASTIRLERGRSNTEVALHVHVGKVDLVFLVPLDDAVRATGEMIRRIDPNSGQPAH
ncbi:MAG: hypothetical protein IT459_22725 [Planctomycetes bacterium]|nr:hypothetical protein [Planctomycetota bacterium]